MSLKASSHVWQNSQHSGGTLLILLALADFADDDGFCWPAVETLAKKARMSERNARYILRSLEASGEVATTALGGRHGTNGYRIVAMAPGMGGAILAGGQPSVAKGGKTRQRRGQPTAPEQSRTIIEQSIKDIARDGAAPETPSVSGPAAKPAKAKAPRERKPMFDAFMAAFPGAHPSKADEFDRATVREGLTVERWHAFMNTPESRKDYPRFLTKMNALDRFVGWHRSARRDPARAREDDPLGLGLKARNDAYLKARGWA